MVEIHRLISKPPVGAVSEPFIREWASSLELRFERANDAEFNVSLPVFGGLDLLFRGTLERCADFIRGFCAARENP